MKQPVLDAIRQHMATGIIVASIGLGLGLGLVGAPTPPAAAAPPSPEPPRDCGIYHNGYTYNRTVEYHRNGTTRREVQTWQCQDGQWVMIDHYAWDPRDR